MSNKELWQQRLKELEEEKINTQNFTIQSEPSFKIGYRNDQFKIRIASPDTPKVKKQN